MTEASQKQPSVIDNYKCKFVMTKEEFARQCFLHHHEKCTCLNDFEPKSIRDKLIFHPSPNRCTSGERSQSSSLLYPHFSSSLTLNYETMVREEPESPTH